MKSFFFVSILTLSSCSVYRSADRAEFENDSPQIVIHSLQKISCSKNTVATIANQSRLLTTVDDEFLWEYSIESQTVFESTNLKGTYCLYDVKFQ